GDRIEHAFFLISFLLSDIFGFEDAVLYEKPLLEERLIPNNTLPSPPFNATPAKPVDLDDHRLREVRVFRRGHYTVEIESGDRLKIVIPLKDFRGKATGVVSIRSQKF